MNARSPTAQSQRLVSRVVQLKELIEHETARTEKERDAFASLDVDALLRRAEQRTAFNDEVNRLVRDLERALPAPSERDRPLKDALRDMRAAATTLAIQGAQNQTLLTRALCCVRGTLRALSPEAMPYGPKARRARTYTPLTAGQIARVSTKG